MAASDHHENAAEIGVELQRVRGLIEGVQVKLQALAEQAGPVAEGPLTKCVVLQRHPSMGFGMQYIESPEDGVVLVTGVTPGSPAEQAGMCKDDKLLSLGGHDLQKHGLQ
eukprot:COSAG01_NODE_51775_length_352_cov_0.608696_1_plen_109_part_01